MHGFKSFAEPVNIEFDRGITCIVGPNGSGKSNISDAIRWVLGEQSPKMLRGGKMEDVIFAGTSTRKSRGMAEVTLVIDNQDGMLPIEYNEVAITRRMYRSGESEYAINNSKCRMRDIKELLVDTGIGVDGYSLIGQGKISDIISNKTESIREIFEETAGVVSYRTKKAEAERKLSASNINMDRVNDIIEEIESRIGGLKEDSEKASEYLELKEKHRDLEINITIDNIEKLKEQIEIYKADIGDLEKLSGAGEAKKVEFEGRLLNLQESLEDIRKKTAEKKTQFEQAAGEMSKAYGDSRVSRERLNSIKRDIERLKREIGDYQVKLDHENGKVDELNKSKSELDEQLAMAEENLQTELKKHGNVTLERDRQADTIARKNDEMFSMSKKLSAMSGEKSSFANLLENLTKTENDASVNFKIYQENIDETEKKLIEEKQRREELLEENSQLKIQLRDIESKGAILKKEKALLENRLKEKDIRKSEILSRKATIQEMEANYEGYNGGVRFVMKRGFEGIRGTVGDLGQPKEGFEIALETALGGKIQNVVCDDDYSAKYAIDQLKKARAGRVTFLPVGEIEGRVRRDSGLEKEPGFLGYADQCVEYSPAYEDIFAYLLGNVVVLENIDYAIKISKKYGRKFQCVTLDGEIFNTSGAVTGGRYKNKTANLFERKGEIVKLEEELSQIEKEKADGNNALETINAKIFYGEEDYKSLSVKERETANNITKTGSEIASLEDKREANRRALATWQESCKNAKFEAEKVNNKIKSLEEEMAKVDQKMEVCQMDIVREQELFQEMESSIHQASECLTEVRLQVSRCQNEQTNVNNLLRFAKENAREYQEDIEKRTKQIANLQYDVEGLGRGIDIHDRTAAEKKILKEKLERELASLNQEKERDEQAMGELNQEKDQVYRKLEQVRGQKYEIDVKLARQEGQMDSYKSKIWEEFQVSYAQALTMKRDDFVMGTAVRENRNIKNRIRELGEVNIGAIREYAQVSERYKFMTAQREDIVQSTEELRKVIEDLDKVIRLKFKNGFDSVAGYFEEIFKEFFGGGQAKIVLEDEQDPLNSSIEIIAQPPGKQLKNINLMSGGEKTMTAIALMFAVVRTKPTPCCILDEVEAALDDHNIHVFANYLRNFEDIQFTLITHQKTTMEHADVMYGVTMPEKGVSKVFSLKMDDDSVKID